MGPAVFVGGWALSQVWLFRIGPLLGAMLAGIAYPWLASERKPALATRLGRAASVAQCSNSASAADAEPRRLRDGPWQ